MMWFKVLSQHPSGNIEGSFLGCYMTLFQKLRLYSSGSCRKSIRNN